MVVVLAVVAGVAGYVILRPATGSHCPVSVTESVTSGTYPVAPGLFGSYVSEFAFNWTPPPGGCPGISTPYVSGTVSFVGCAAASCSGNTTIYTGSQWTDLLTGDNDGFVWCYPGSSTTVQEGPCVGASVATFSTEAPYAYIREFTYSGPFDIVYTDPLATWENVTASVTAYYDTSA